MLIFMCSNSLLWLRELEYFLGFCRWSLLRLLFFCVVDFILGVGIGYFFLVTRVFGQGIVRKLVHAGAPTKLDEFYA